MQIDLQSLVFVLYLRHPSVMKRSIKKGLLVPRWGRDTYPLGHQRTSRPFFVLVRNVSMEDK